MRHLRREAREARRRLDDALSIDSACTRGADHARHVRTACVFWVQSMVREDARRATLFDLDMAIVRLTRDHPGDPALVSLTGVYHNLLRMWAEP